MDYTFESKWKEMIESASAQFGEKLDYAALLVLIGFQELGQDFRSFKKDEKISLMHIAICVLLEPYGYYKYLGRDEDGWPHFERTTNLPPLSSDEQELLIRKAIVNYFDEQKSERPPNG